MVTTYAAGEASQVQQASVSRAAAASSMNQNGANFRSLMKDLFHKSTDVLRLQADPDVDEITLEGLGTYEKGSSAFQMASSFYITLNQIQIETALDYINFIYKTLPQKIEPALFG